MKLICAGLPKTGTKSIANALRILGYKVYDIDDQILHYMDEWLDLFNVGKVPDFYSMFKDVDAVIDVPSNLFFEELMEAFPDAKVILSIRKDEDAWMQSYTKQVEVYRSSFLTRIRRFLPTHAKFLRILFGTRMAAFGVADLKSSYICRKRYRLHNDRVRSVVPPEKLLVFGVEQGWGPLCDFLGMETPDMAFPHLNVKGQVFKTIIEDTELGRKITREAQNLVVLCTAVIFAVLGIVLIYFVL
ncbi:uncharacterized protein LOC116305565 [Actinia tenebrosa]|uniref:Uncharacterized protein LOC116305565 n=1 Tax=Actinia tenebrosa TaxID=6105 RepID=A0A6P8IWE6_ACTTE|nr:uncharacterized protein LOC116305565 [Actinia tenebrosa]